MVIRSDSLNIVSLCTGGGGLDLGLELAIPNARPVCMVEREAYAVAHLVRAMEGGLLASAPVWADVSTFNGRPWRGFVDGVIGGIPCQPHSLAGKQLGEDDESDARRIIVQSGAWFALIENVKGMLSSGGAERVWNDLRRLGFDIEAGLFSASEVGDSQERDRVFILAVSKRSDGPLVCSNGGLRHGWTDIERGQQAERIAFERSSGLSNVFQTGKLSIDNVRGLFPPRPNDADEWRRITEAAQDFEPAFRRVADGLANRMDTDRIERIRMLGNGVVPLQAAYALRTLITRLAGRSTGARRLLEMMGGAND